MICLKDHRLIEVVKNDEGLPEISEQALFDAIEEYYDCMVDPNYSSDEFPYRVYAYQSNEAKLYALTVDLEMINQTEIGRGFALHELS